MNLDQSNIYDLNEGGDEQLTGQLNVAKFKYLAKEKFQDFVKERLNYVELVQTSAKLSAYNIPREYNEFFIRLENAAGFWILDGYIQNQAEEYLKNGSKNVIIKNSTFTEIKNFYNKWITNKGEKEKQYFALTAINQIERDLNKNNFLKYFLYASILTFDKKIFSPEKAAELLSKCREIVVTSAIDESLRKEYLYLIELYLGFISLKSGDYAFAKENFTNAKEENPYGVTATFYKAVAEKYLNNYNASQDLLMGILEYDRNRFKFAIDNNSLGLFSFFVQNAVFYNVFSEHIFADMISDLDLMITSNTGSYTDMFERVSGIIVKLEEMELTQYYTEKTTKQIEFLKKFVLHFKDSRNQMIFIAGRQIYNKLTNIVDEIIEKISQHYNNLKAVEIKIYDENIAESEEAVKILTNEIEESKIKIGKSEKETISKIEEHHNHIIEALEYKSENLEAKNKFDPAATFSNSMMMNIVVSIVVFFVGGFAGSFFNSSGLDTYSSMFRDTMYEGVKWGGITFLIGIFVALFSAASAVWERANAKQRILKEITFVKNHKEREIQYYKKEFQRKAKSYEDNYRKRIEGFKEKIELLTREKQEKESSLSQNSNEEISKMSEKLQSILTF